jgi:hypothetical protein
MYGYPYDMVPHFPKFNTPRFFKFPKVQSAKRPKKSDKAFLSSFHSCSLLFSSCFYSVSLCCAARSFACLAASISRTSIGEE